MTSILNLFTLSILQYRVVGSIVGVVLAASLVMLGTVRLRKQYYYIVIGINVVLLAAFAIFVTSVQRSIR